jgi:hypothetical protein
MKTKLMIALITSIAVAASTSASAQETGSDWSVTFGGRTFGGTSDVTIEFSTDGTSYTTVGTESLDINDTPFDVPLDPNAAEQAYVRFTFDPSSGQPVIDNVAINATVASQSVVVAGWDFSQYFVDGALSVDAETYSDILTANYSNLDSTLNAGLESAGFGRLYFNGQFGSTDVNEASPSAEFVPTGAAGVLGGSLDSNLNGIAPNPFDSRIILLAEGQRFANFLGMTAPSPVSIVFEAFPADVCNAVGGDRSLSKAAVILKNFHKTGEQKQGALVKGFFNPADTPAFEANGATLQVETGDGTIIDLTVPGGLTNKELDEDKFTPNNHCAKLDKKGRSLYLDGWKKKVAGSGVTSWIYANKSGKLPSGGCADGSANGLKKILVKDLTTKPPAAYLVKVIIAKMPVDMPTPTFPVEGISAQFTEGLLPGQQAGEGKCTQFAIADPAPTVPKDENKQKQAYCKRAPKTGDLKKIICKGL